MNNENTCTELAKLTREQRLNPKIIAKIIDELTPQINYMASRIAIKLPSHAFLGMDDLVNAGVVGLIDAVGKFDINKQNKFKTYAKFRIRGAMKDELRAMDWIPRTLRMKEKKVEYAYSELDNMLGRPATDEEMAAKLNITPNAFFHLLDEIAPALLLSLDYSPEKPDYDEEYNKNLLGLAIQDKRDWPSYRADLVQTINALINAVMSLPLKELAVISLYYYDELTMKEVGLVLKMTESRVSQIHAKAIPRLRRKLKKFLAPSRKIVF